MNDSEPAAPASDVDMPHISGEFIRQAILGEVSVPANSALKIDSHGVRLEGAIIEGGLDLEAVEFKRPIEFKRCNFLGPIILRNARLGGVSLRSSRAPRIDAQGARIEGDLYLRGAQLENPSGIAFNGQSMHVTGGVALSDGFSAHGAVWFGFSHIEGSLICFGGKFHHTCRRTAADIQKTVQIFREDAALSLVGTRVGPVGLSNGFHAEGLVTFAFARIGGGLNAIDCSFVATSGASGLWLEYADVGGPILLADARKFEGVPSLTGTTCQYLVDDGSFWRDPEGGGARPNVMLHLEGLRYDGFRESLAAGTGSTWRARLAWLKAQPKEQWTTDFRPQPFTQCAEALRNAGDAHGARQILFEQAKLRLKSKHVKFFERLGGHALGVLAGYGYKSHYALLWALAVWLTGALIFGVGARLGEMRPADPHVLAEAHYQETGLPPADYEPLKPLVFSADILIPIVDLGQEHFWMPRDAGERRANAAAAFPGLPAPLAAAVDWLFGGWLQKAYYYFAIAMGWVLVSITIAGFSGLLGHAKEE